MVDQSTAEPIVLELPGDWLDDARRLLSDQASRLDERICGVELDHSTLTIRFSTALDESEKAKLLSALRGLAEQTEKSFTKVHSQVVASHPGQATFDRDPLPFLQASRQAIETHRGVFVFRGDLMRAISAIDAFWLRYALSLGAEEQLYPTTVPLRSLAEAGYLTSLPHHALMVARARSDFDALTSIARADAIDGVDHLAATGQMLSPTVCYHCFEALRGRPLASTGRLVTATAPCHRYEGAATAGLARLQTFSMREIIFFGTPQHVREKNERIASDTCRQLERWDVGFRLLNASDPFFAGTSGTKRSFQSLQGLKQELRVTVPFDGSSLACASFNNHLDTLVKAYRIVDETEATLASGCVGYGLARIAYCLFAHFGTSVSGWPQSLRADLRL